MYIHTPVIQPNLIYPDMEVKNVELRRVFKGKTEFTLTTIDPSTPETLQKTTEQRETDKRERHYYQRMLRAYLKGKDYFNFGFQHSADGRSYPEEHKVMQAWE